MLKTSSNNSVGIYIPSYKRAENVNKNHLISLEKITFVVRESEKDEYLKNGAKNIIGVEDSKINSLGKVRQWIIENAREDVVIQIDDDVDNFFYKLKNNAEEVESEDVIEQELLRIAQILIDLKLGLASIEMSADVRKTNREFKWSGCTGGINWFNKSCIKGKYSKDLMKVDTDFMLQELLANRICIVPAYFGAYVKKDTNKGGNQCIKTYERLVENNMFLKQKWGKYFDFDYNRNVTKVKVER